MLQGTQSRQYFFLAGALDIKPVVVIPADGDLDVVGHDGAQCFDVKVCAQAVI